MLGIFSYRLQHPHIYASTFWPILTLTGFNQQDLFFSEFNSIASASYIDTWACWGRAKQDFSAKVISQSFHFWRRKLDNGQNQQFEGGGGENELLFANGLVTEFSRLPGAEKEKNCSAHDREEIDPPVESAQRQSPQNEDWFGCGYLVFSTIVPHTMVWPWACQSL